MREGKQVTDLSFILYRLWDYRLEVRRMWRLIDWEYLSFHRSVLSSDKREK